MKKWGEEQHNHLIELRSRGATWNEIAERMTARFGYRYTGEQCRSRWRTNRHKIVEPKGYKETIEIKPDGTQVSDRLIEISEEDLKSERYLLKAHGYDPAEWEITSAKSSMWQHHNKQDGTKTLYASKITVKPKGSEFDWDKFLETVKQVPKAIIKPKHIPKQENKYLLLPLYDMHFGISDYEYYMPTQAKILDLLKNNYKEVLLIFGQDAFHNDDFRGRTSSGREIQKVDMVKAWNDATSFFEPIIREALSRNSKVHVMYSRGNHSETVEWMFVQRLKARFPQCTFDDSLKERKAYMLGKNFCGASHGDKKNEKNLPENFATEFPVEWSKATTRTVFTGHRHAEMVVDVGGVMVRRMPTRNVTDGWHDDMGYTTAHKRFQVFEYSEKELESIHYV